MLHNGHDKIAIPIVSGLQFVRHSEIVRLQSNGNYTVFYFSDKTTVTSSHNLLWFEKLLPQNDFFRVNRSHIINLNCLKSYSRCHGGMVMMDDGFEIDIARSRKEKLLEIFR